MTVEEEKRLSIRALDRAHWATTSQDILLFLVAFRIVNALSIRTFFQPDEFFQSLEPAWEIAFGRDSGAWITWVSGKITLLESHALTIKVGMEAPASVCYTSYHICRDLLAGREPVPALAAPSGLACWVYDSCTKDNSGGFCGAG